MGEIRIVGTGKTSGYPYPVCKKTLSHHRTALVETIQASTFEVSSENDRIHTDVGCNNL